jgi:outer membrane protein TolC
MELMFGGWLSSSALAKEVSLREAYQTSIERTQSVAIQESRKAQTREQVNQAQGSLFPTIALNSNYLRQDTGDTSGADGVSAFRNPDQYTTRVTLTQPIFRGLRDFAGMSMARSQLQAQESNTEQAKLNLYSTVAQSYYNVLAAEQDIVNLETIIKLTRDRIRELQAQSRIGRSRKGDVLFAQSQLATLDAQIDAARAQLDQARTQFQLVTGLPKESQLTHNVVIPSQLSDLDFYLNRIEGRPDIRSFQQQLEATEKSVSVARGNHLPSIDFTGNYYLQRSGVLANSKWDLGVALSIPIFQGGVVQAQVRQALARTQEQELVLQQARREAQAQLISSHRLVRAGLEQIHALSQSFEIAEKNYREQVRDYGLGLVRNLEVLQALNSLQDTKRSLDRVKYQTLSAWALLETASNTVFN